MNFHGPRKWWAAHTFTRHSLSATERHYSQLPSSATRRTNVSNAVKIIKRNIMQRSVTNVLLLENRTIYLSITNEEHYVKHVNGSPTRARVRCYHTSGCPAGSRRIMRGADFRFRIAMPYKALGFSNVLLHRQNFIDQVEKEDEPDPRHQVTSLQVTKCWRDWRPTLPRGTWSRYPHVLSQFSFFS